MKIGTFDITPRQEYITEVRRYELITPLFGGGVMPQQPDPISIIRATSVRGQLRFWWRATRGGQFVSIEELRKAEEVLWGGATVLDKDGKRQSGGPGLVQVEVEALTKGERYVPYEIDENKNRKRRSRLKRPAYVPEYAAFPLQPTDEEQQQNIPESQMKAVTLGVRFELMLVITDIWPNGSTIRFRGTPQQEVAAALWAWETFGGIGGRTRRGFGALQLLEIGKKDGSNTIAFTPATYTELADLNQIQWKNHVITTQSHEQVPYLSDPNIQLKVISGYQTGYEAWSYLITKLKEFRQYRDPPTGHPPKPGRSHWPEPDSIRRVLKIAHPFHLPRLMMNKFPRAAFGLPIVTKFKDERNGDPGKTTLQTKNSTRRASPLILRPLRCQDAQGKPTYAAVALILGGMLFPDDELYLVEDASKKVHAVSSAPLTIAEARTIQTHSDLKGSHLDLTKAGRPDGTIDVLRAFLDTL